MKNEATNRKDDTENNARQRGIQSVEQANGLLSVFIESTGPMSLKAIAERMDMATSSAHRYLVSLRRSGLVAQDELTGLYELGPTALHLGLAFMRRMDSLGVAEATARQLAITTRQTTFVSIWTDSGPAIVRWFHGDRIIITTASIGTILPVFASSTGRVFAAHLPDALFEKLALVENRYTLDELTAQRAETTKRGYAWINESITPGLFAVAAPVLNLQGQAAAVVTLLGTESSLVRFPNAALDALLAATGKASTDIGYQTSPRDADKLASINSSR